MNRNAQVRIDGLGAQASASSNRTFENIKLNKLSKLMVRKVVRSKRDEVTKALKEAKVKADKRKLHLREVKVEARKTRDRMQHARRLIEWGVEPHHTGAWYAANPGQKKDNEVSIEHKLKDAGPVAKREEILKQNYHCIITGWGNEQYQCCFSGNSRRKLCNCMCGGKTAFQKGKHMEVE